MPTLRDILGIPVLVADRTEAIRAIDKRLEAASPAQITFLNAHASNATAGNTQLRRIFQSSLVLNDGIGVSIASRVLAGADFPANLEGTSFTPLYLAGSKHQFRIFIIGAAEGVAERAMQALAAFAPNQKFVGARNGFFSEEESQSVTDAIIASGANLVLVGMGTPQQEVFARRWINEYAGLSAICVGGLLDFVSGEKPRAPRWVRDIRCEWMFRLMIEPRRLWQRYIIGNPIFLARVFNAALRARLRGANQTATR